jgi:hypothetical protein
MLATDSLHRILWSGWAPQGGVAVNGFDGQEVPGAGGSVRDRPGRAADQRGRLGPADRGMVSPVPSHARGGLPVRAGADTGKHAVGQFLRGQLAVQEHGVAGPGTTRSEARSATAPGRPSRCSGGDCCRRVRSPPGCACQLVPRRTSRRLSATPRRGAGRYPQLAAADALEVVGQATHSGPSRPQSSCGRPGTTVGQPPQLPVRRRPWPCDDILDLPPPYAHHPDFPRHA